MLVVKNIKQVNLCVKLAVCMAYAVCSLDLSALFMVALSQLGPNLNQATPKI